MANFTDPTNPAWPDIYILAETDPVEGGPDGVDNLPHKQLLERTAHIRSELLDLEGVVNGHASTLGTLSAASALSVARAYTLEQRYSDEGFEFELFSGINALSFRDFESVAVTETVSGDDSIDVENTDSLREGEAYILCDSDGRFVQAIEVDNILSQTRLTTKSSLSTTLADADGATLRRSTFVVTDGQAEVRDQDRLYSRVLYALHYWDQGRLVIRRTATGTGVLSARYRVAGTEAWASAQYLGGLQREQGTRDEEWEIGIGGDIELQIDYTGQTSADSDTIYHAVLFTPPRIDMLSLIQQPSNVSPAQQATNVGETPTLTGSVYRSIYGLSQQGAQFQVARDASFSDIVLNTSTDFLASWEAVSQAETVQDLNDIALSGSGLGLAVGAASAIITSSDAGETWSTAAAAGAANLLCAAQSDAYRFAGGATGTLERSIKGEDAWGAWSACSLAGGYSGAVRGVALQGFNVVAVGDTGGIQTSSDSGTFFTARSADASFTGVFHDVAMDGSGNCIAVGASGTIQTSNNFGVTWTARSTDNTYTGVFYAASINESGDALIVGETGEVQTSADYGATWVRRTSANGGAYTGAFRAAVIAADGSAVIAGSDGEIQTSEDGGITWYKRTAAGAFSDAFYGVSINANNDAVLVGAGGEVQKTNQLDSATTTHTVPAGADMLLTGLIYWWRLRYQDADGNWSPWSQPTAFATSASFDYVEQPMAISPSNNATSVATKPTLQGSPFAFRGVAVTHAKSQWQISEIINFSVLTYNTGESDDLVSHTLPDVSELSADAQYYWRLRYKDSADKWSAWSTPAAFSTLDLANTPVITSPANNATNVSLTPTITTSAFSIPGGGDAHAATQYEIAADAGFSSIVYSSGDTSDLVAHTLDASDALTADTGHYMRARHKGLSGKYTAWSPVIQVTTMRPAGQMIFASPGSITWTVPLGVTSVDVTVIGGGGGGGRSGGGGGGAYCYRINTPVTPGATIGIQVGGGGTGYPGGTLTPGSAGGSSSFSALVTATGGGGGESPSTQWGDGGAGGTSSGGTGNSGGAGGDSYVEWANKGTGGGGGAGGYGSAGGRGGGAQSIYTLPATTSFTGGGGGGHGISDGVTSTFIPPGGGGGAGYTPRTGVSQSVAGEGQGGAAGSGGTAGGAGHLAYNGALRGGEGGRYGGGGGASGASGHGGTGGSGHPGVVYVIWG